MMTMNNNIKELYRYLLRGYLVLKFDSHDKYILGRNKGERVWVGQDFIMGRSYNPYEYIASSCTGEEVMKSMRAAGR